MESFKDGAHSVQGHSDRLLQGEYMVDVFGFIRQAWELFLREPVKFVGFTLVLAAVYTISQFVGTMPVYLAGYVFDTTMNAFLIYGLSILVLVLLSLLVVPLYSGGCIAAFGLMSGRTIGFGEFFHGYRYWLPLCLYSIVQGLITFLAVSAISLFWSVFGMALAYSGHKGSLTAYRDVFFLLAMMPMIIIPIFIIVVYVFSQPLIIDRRLGFWQAMERSRKVVTKRWFSVFGLLTVLILLYVPGFLVFAIFQNTFTGLVLFAGLLVTIPLSSLTVAVAYKEIFGLQSSDW